MCGSCVGACAGSCLYKGVTSICGCKPTHRRGSLVPYLFLMLVATVLAIVLRFGFSDDLSSLFYESLGDCDTCVGYGAVFRVSFSIFLFFATHALLLCFPLCWRVDQFNWLGKVVYWLALLVVAFVLPEDFYGDFYVHVSRVVGGFFLFLQVVILIDFAHGVNEKWNSVPEEQQFKFKAAILASSLAMLLASLALLILFFIWWGKDCGLNKFFISFTLCGTFLICCLCVTERFSEKGGILPAAIVTLYCWWLCYSGLNSDPSSCNTRQTQGPAQLIIGLIVAACSIAYAGWSVGTHAGLFGKEEEAAAKAIEDRAAQEVEMGALSTAAVDGDRDAAHKRALALESDSASAEYALVARRNCKFHLVMAACSMYMAMLLTNWGSHQAAEYIDGADGKLSGTAYDLSAESMWIKFASQWATMALFTWSVVAPVVCAGRDFS